MYDLLAPALKPSVVLYWSPFVGSWAGGLTWHVAASRDELVRLVEEALAVRAALALQFDSFPHCSHVWIRCRAGNGTTTTFVHVGTDLMSGDLDDYEEESPVEQSLNTFRGCVDAALDPRNSALTTLAADILPTAKQVVSVWLACVVDDMSSVTDTAKTLHVLSKTRSAFDTGEFAHPKPTPENWSAEAAASKSDPLKLQHVNTVLALKRATSEERSAATRSLEAERADWLTTKGLEKTGNHGGLVNVNPDPAFSRRLRIRLEQMRPVWVGSSRNEDDGTARLSLAHFGILESHCILESQGDCCVLVTLPEKGAPLIMVNGKEINDDITLSPGDTLAFGYSALFFCEDTERAAELDCWERGLAGLYETEIESKLWHPNDTHRTNRVMAWERTNLENRFKAAVALVVEANTIADDLGRDTRFELMVNGFDSATERITFSAVASSAKYDVADAWSEKKLALRLSTMRAMRRRWIHDFDLDLTLLDAEYPIVRDPFYDPPDHLLVGIAFVYLDALNYLIDIKESVPISNFRGDPVGELAVHLTPSISGNPKAEDGAFDTEELSLSDYMGQVLDLQIRVQCAKHIPAKTCASVFVRTNWFLSKQHLDTPRAQLDTTSPFFDTRFNVRQIISSDFLNYLKDSALEFQVWGQSVVQKKKTLKKRVVADSNSVSKF